MRTTDTRKKSSRTHEFSRVVCYSESIFCSQLKLSLLVSKGFSRVLISEPSTLSAFDINKIQIDWDTLNSEIRCLEGVIKMNCGQSDSD